MNTLMLRRRAMMAALETPITNPILVYTPNTCLISQAPIDGVSRAGSGASDYLPVEAGNRIVYKNAVAPASLQTSSGMLGAVIVYASNKSSCDWWNCRANGEEASFTAQRFTGSGYVRINIVMEGIADSYCYNSSTGTVYYAGQNTPYYGKANIND